MTLTVRRASAEQTTRFRGVLPGRLLRWRRPAWWQEIAIIAFGYWLYTLGRNAIPDERQTAITHGRDIARLQRSLHLNWERAVNHYVAARPWLAQPMDYYYATLHFVITLGVLVWLYDRRPQIYRGARTVLVAITLLGLLGFYLYPTAPPRLLPGSDYIDTVVKFHTWGSLADPNIAEHSNQYAAMPSLHIGWAIWCGLAVYACARRRWVRLLGAGYPVGTFLVIIATGNHYVLDALAGALVVLLGLGVQWLLSGRGAFVAPADAPPLRGEPRRAAAGGAADQP